jgi:predicted GNAT family N-acyltransferase
MHVKMRDYGGVFKLRPRTLSVAPGHRFRYATRSMPDTAIVIRRVTWEDAGAAIRAVREAVFVREQGVPLDLEMDGLDAACVQVLALTTAADPVGTARLAADGKIGRMAVVSHWRGHGVGSALVRALVGIAVDLGLSRAHLAAQVHAVPFYERHGFEVEGAVFLEAGIAHCRMVRILARGPTPR